MISFRFHVVSITAVFLAIAIGVVVGSTFVDRAVVDGLENRIDTVSGNLDDRLSEIDRLNDDLDRVRGELEGALPYSVSGRLPGTPLLVLAERGVDEDAVRRVVELARQAGAVAPGIVWIEPRWALGDDDATAELAALVGVTSRSADVVRSEAWEGVLAELAAPPPEPGDEEAADPTTTTSEPDAGDGSVTTTSELPTTVPPESTPAVDPVVLRALLESGYLSFEGVGDGTAVDALVGQGPAVVAVTGNRVEPALVASLGSLLEELLDVDASTVVAEVYAEPDPDEEGAPERGATLRAAIGSVPTTTVSTVDHLDRPVGAVAVVLALADQRRGVTGYYGYGDDASSVLPPFTPL